jgi:hypothetical protein
MPPEMLAPTSASFGNNALDAVLRSANTRLRAPNGSS